ncbi:MFS transporter DHA2 family multidrug resistance protein [termite gut metagenome]|uniref:MFS transporter DHA2 family multidrug resistance protein n=1 Tax=termite gut metagenome TaxID=433724 RepID=A0A5J4S3U9_9ZZZZ
MAWNKSQKASLFIISTALFLGTFLVSSINIALSVIGKQFELNAVTLSWIITAYLLATALLMLPVGRWADMHDKQKVFKYGIAVFSVGTVLCALAPYGWFLIVSRFIQGMGIALPMSVGNAILMSIFPPNQRGRVLGISISFIYTGLALGPFLGGILTELLGWRSIFYMGAVLGIAVTIAAFMFLGKGKHAENLIPLKFKGTCVYGLSLLALIYGSSTIPRVFGWLSIVLGIALMALFFRIENKSSFPVLNVKLFTKNKLFTFSTLSALINYSATFAIVFLLSLYLQKIKLLSPREAGFVLLVQPLVMALFSPLMGRLSDKIEPRFLATSGMTLCTLGLVSFAFLSETTPIHTILAVLVMVGLGFAMFSSPNMNTIMSSVEKNIYGLASSITETMRVLGQMVSMTIATLLFSIFFASSQVADIPNDVFVKTISISFGVFAIICSVGIAFSYFRGNVRQKNG